MTLGADLGYELGLRPLWGQKLEMLMRARQAWKTGTEGKTRGERLEGGPPHARHLGGGQPLLQVRGDQIPQGGEQSSPQAGDSHQESQEPLGGRHLDFASI